MGRGFESLKVHQKKGKVVVLTTLPFFCKAEEGLERAGSRKLNGTLIYRNNLRLNDRRNGRLLPRRDSEQRKTRTREGKIPRLQGI